MLRVFEAFAGIGSQRKALENKGIDHKVVGIAEIDKYALVSYEAIHGDCPNVGDISKLTIDMIPDHDLFTYSFPCQDISIAGKLNGLEEGSGTRSSLLWECKKVIEGKKPKYLLLENVKNLVGKKNKPDFDKWLSWLESKGYTNYWKVVNAKNCGIPQNRERVFCVSILGEHKPFEFQVEKPLELTLKDLLETDVDEKYYLSDEIVSKFIYNPSRNSDGLMREGILDVEHGLRNDMKRVYSPEGISPALMTMQGGNRQPKILVVGNTNPSGRSMNGKVYDSDGLAPTVTTNKGEGSKILIKNATLKGYFEAEYGDGIDLDYPESTTRRGRVQKGMAQTLRANDRVGVIVGEQPIFRIRKLTPRECWLLMGFTNEDFDKAAQVNSNSQLYKQAGNSIVVQCLEGIFENLFK